MQLRDVRFVPEADNNAPSLPGISPPLVRLSYCIGTGRSNSGLKNRLPRAAKMIGVNPITAA